MKSLGWELPFSFHKVFVSSKLIVELVVQMYNNFQVTFNADTEVMHINHLRIVQSVLLKCTFNVIRKYVHTVQ